VPLGEYTLVYRAPGTAEGRVTDFIHGVVILAGKGTEQDVDMTRQEFIDRLSPEDQERLRQLKESNDKAADTNKMIATINADLNTANQDFEDAANARATAIRSLDSTASALDVDSMVYEIKVSKYTEIESLMSKAVTDWPSEATLWIYLGRAQVGLKNYIDAETSFKKAVDLTSQAGNPGPQATNIDPQDVNGPQAANIDPQIAGAAKAGLAEVYARTRMVDEANASVAAAVKADPAHRATYLRNLAVIFFQEGNALAQIDAADEAIKANPQDAVLYFIKAQGLTVDAPIDPDTNKIKLSPECLVAFREYLGLAPTGEYAAQVTAILQNADPQITGPQNTAPQNTGKDTGSRSPPAQ
jgi:tetratricopeptide (TPR) repeat protein